MVYDFAINSDKFEEECKIFKIPCDEKKEDLENVINLLNYNKENEFNNVNDTLKRYDHLQLQIMKYISLQDSDVISICISAKLYSHQINFIREAIARDSEENCELLSERLHKLMFMQYEFYKMYIIIKLLKSTTINDSNLSVVIDIADVITKFKVLGKSNITDCYVQPNITECYVQIVESLEYIANYYYNGIEGYIYPNKKLAIYYLFVAYYIVKKYNETDCRSAYRKIFDMYDDAVNNNIDVDIIIHPFSKLKKLDATEVKEQENSNIYIAIKAVLTSKTVCKLDASDRNLVHTHCMGCNTTRKLKKCLRCKVARFCSNECMQLSWGDHKQYCTIWAAEAEAE
jgi:hypothetical protein